MTSDEEATSKTAPPLVVPRWYVITVQVFCVVAVIVWLVLEQWLVGIFLALILFIAIFFFRLNGNRFSSRATYGSSALAGLLYVGVGVYGLVLGGRLQLVGGLFFLILGVLTLFAFAPGYFRNRAVSPGA